jgi:uncharacterized protein (TIGR03437 family)
VGLNQRFSLAFTAAVLLSAGALSAAPRLRLVSTTVGPISIAQGANGAPQTVEIYNAGDGSLSPKLTSSVSWIGTSAGVQTNCVSRVGVCIPLQISLNTASLPAGITTGIVTVADNDATVVDAPQTITVTVAIGGAVPSSVDVYVAPGSVRDIEFSTNSQLVGIAKTNDGGPWLSLAVDGTGTFRFLFPYRIHVAPSATMPIGTYPGTLTTAGSNFAPDNRSIPVTMRVTTQPIAQASSSHVQVRLAQGAPPLTTAVSLTNLGQGTLTLQGALANGVTGLTATTSGNVAVLTFDAGTTSPGVYSGTVTLTSNAANVIAPIPVDFTVVAKGAPVINYQGVVDNGTFTAGDTVARGDVMVVLGDQLSFAPLTVGKAPPLDTQVGGASVTVNGRPAPMYYSSYGQLAFQLPYEINNGTAVVQVQRDGLTSNPVSVQVADRAPRLLLIGVGTYGAIQNQDLSIPMPVGSFPGVNTHPAKAGDALTIYAIGLGPTTPGVVSGQPAPATSPFAPLTSTATINFGAGPGGMVVVPLYAGLTPTFAGLYQINVVVPQGLPKGAVNLTVNFSDSSSNAVQIYVE